MSKIQKENIARKDKIRDLENQKTILKNSMYSSAKITYILAAIFLIISFLFNGRMLSWAGKIADEVQSMEDNATGPTLLYIIDVIIKSISITLFFLFAFISIGNYKELTGDIMTSKEMMILIIISIAQATAESTIFFYTVIGISLVLTYMYFIQGKIKKNY